LKLEDFFDFQPRAIPFPPLISGGSIEATSANEQSAFSGIHFRR